MKSPKKNRASLVELEAHFQRAIELPKPLREAYLKHACLGKPELEAEVRSLLKSSEDAPDFLVKPPKVEVAIRRKEMELDSSVKQFQPKKFGNYLLLRKMGMGGTAEIFHAIIKGVGGFEKQVAIKSVLPQLSKNSEFRDLFENEARINSLLTHPNIAQVFDFFRAGDNYFLSMEFVAGKNLKQVMDKLKRTRLSQPLACYVIGEAAKGLAYAHSLKNSAQGISFGIIHRDVSPKNIMCSYDGAVKIIDFGIAKVREQMHAETQSIALKGTFRYMSPEHAFSEKLDHRCDIFSLGLVLFELLTGKSLFRALGLVKALNELREYNGAEAHLKGKNLPTALNTILKKALAVKPEDRYSTAEGLYNDIREYLRIHAFDSGYAQVGSFMQKLFSAEIAAERASTASAISEVEKAEELAALTGSETSSGRVIIPMKMEMVSLVLPKATEVTREAGPTRGASPPPIPSRAAAPARFRSLELAELPVQSPRSIPASNPKAARSQSLLPPESSGPKFLWAIFPVLLGGIALAAFFSRPQLRVPSVAPLAQRTPATPTIELLAPKNGQEFFQSSIPLGVTFSWRGQPGLLYRLELGRNEDFSGTFATLTTSNAYFTYDRQNLTAGRYYWRVGAVEPSGKIIGQTPTFTFLYH